MSFSPLINELVSALKILPGVGVKSAQRMAFSLLERNREGALHLSKVLHDAMEHVSHCEQCRTFTESRLCKICDSPLRSETGQLCIVESPQDVLAIEQTSEYKATAHYIGQMCKEKNIKATRIAHGVPVGGELEYIDGNTLTHAFTGRRQF
jgi:recombination protein RecR